MKIKDRTFVVTGGASGLGQAAVRELHGQGGYIAILDLNSDSGDAMVKELGGGDRAKFFRVDVSDTDSVQDCTKSVIDWSKSTGKEIGGIVAAAGVGAPGKIITPKGQPLNIDAWDFVVNINLRGVVDVIRNLLPAVVKNNPGDDGERGVIIMVSSVAAYDGQPGQLAYSATKGAIASMTLPMARDLASAGVRVVAIAPGVFESAMTDKMSEKVRNSLLGVMEFPKRMGRADEFAQLCTEVVKNRMINATTIRLDGAVRMPSKM